ncbi:MAG: hypothetical protein IIC87_06850 [Chloroflexi bacterium]|nr:hypothetical protein [Chloroflexota bacterium]
MATREMRFPFDEKGLKGMVGRLPGTEMSYWEGDSLLRGRVTAAVIKRDRYGKPYVEVELEEVPAAPRSPSST